MRVPQESPNKRKQASDKLSTYLLGIFHDDREATNNKENPRKTTIPNVHVNNESVVFVCPVWKIMLFHSHMLCVIGIKGGYRKLLIRRTTHWCLMKKHLPLLCKDILQLLAWGFWEEYEATAASFAVPTFEKYLIISTKYYLIDEVVSKNYPTVSVSSTHIGHVSPI